MTDKNLAIWDELRKVDPAHTKPFKRSGGFSGTATKPIWLTMRMTSYFGPCGVGWGTTAPEFQVINAGDEILVYCTVGLWHTKPEYLVYGVGGDKVRTIQSAGPKNSDEAFKGAHTDAIGNAMKSIGMIADIHMGLFDDSKYVREMAQEFSGQKADDGDNQFDPAAYVANATDWINSQTVIAAIHAGWNDELNNFDKLSNDQRQKLQAVRDAKIASLAAKADHPLADAAQDEPSAEEVWTNKQIASMGKLQSAVKLDAFLKAARIDIDKLPLYCRGPFDKAVADARRRLTGISAPSGGSSAPLNLDDEIKW